MLYHISPISFDQVNKALIGWLRPNQVSSQWKRCQSLPLASTLPFKAIFLWIQEGKSTLVPMEGNLLHFVVEWSQLLQEATLSSSPLPGTLLIPVAGPVPLKAPGKVSACIVRGSLWDQSLIANHQGMGKRPVNFVLYCYVNIS